MENRRQRTNTAGRGRSWNSAPSDFNPSSMIGSGIIPPQNVDMEKAVLGAMMLDKNAYDTLVEIIKPEVFYVNAHQEIFRAAMRLSDKAQPIDLLTLVHELKAANKLEEVGGPYYVTQLSNEVVSAANIEAHARIVMQKYILREIIRIGGNAVNDSFREEKDVFDILDEIGADLFNVSTGHVKKDFKPISATYQNEFIDLQVRTEKKQDITGVPSGFRALDRITYGWQPTDLIIIAARPSVGKSAFALNLALNAAFHSTPVKAAVFNLEMSNSQVTQRCMAAKCEVKLDSIKRGRFEPWELQELRTKWNNHFLNDKIYFDDTAALSVLELRAKARRLVHKHGVGLIIIDYLQLMSGGAEGKNGNREQEISKISRQLKALAKELQVPVIALSQLSRDVEKRGSKEPLLSDLRESGAIEQDADVVAFLYRDDYQQEAHKVDEHIRGNTSLKIAKNRNGSLETIALKADLSIQKFREPDFMEAASSNYIPMSEASSRFAEAEDQPF